MSRFYFGCNIILIGFVLTTSVSLGQSGRGAHDSGSAGSSGGVESENRDFSELPACCQKKIEYFKTRARHPANDDERKLIEGVASFMSANPISDAELSRALHDVFGNTAPPVEEPVTDFSDKLLAYTQQRPGSATTPSGTGANPAGNNKPTIVSSGPGTALSLNPNGVSSGKNTQPIPDSGVSNGPGLGANPPPNSHPGIGLTSPTGETTTGIPVVSGTKPNTSSNSNGAPSSPALPTPSPTLATQPPSGTLTSPVIPQGNPNTQAAPSVGTPNTLPSSVTATGPAVKSPTPPTTPQVNPITESVAPTDITSISRPTVSNSRIPDIGSNAPDFSYALTQNFQFNRPNPSPETRNEINTISPTPIPDFYAMAPKIAALPAEPIATKPTLSTPMTSPALEGIKKTVPNQVALSTLEPKLEKLNPVEIPKPSFSLEPLSFAKSTESASNPPATPVSNPSPSSFSMPSSNSLVGASIPTLVLPLLQEKTKEGQWLAPVTNIAQEIPKRMPTNLSNPTTTPSGTSNTSIPVPAGTTAQNNSLAKENQATPSNVSGIFTEIKAILNRSRTATSEKVEFTSNEPSEATRKLSSVEFAPTQFSESAPWKVVFLEKSGKQLSLANVMIAFGSTLLLIWILLMRLRRESKAAKATQSALLPIRKNDED